MKALGLGLGEAAIWSITRRKLIVWLVKTDVIDEWPVLGEGTGMWLDNNKTTWWLDDEMAWLNEGRTMWSISIKHF